MTTNSNRRLPSRRAFLLTAAGGVLGAGGYAGWEVFRDRDVAAPPRRAARWTFKASDDLKFGMADDGNGRLFAATGYHAGLLALDAADGRGRWHKKLGEGPWQVGPLTVADGTLYVVDAAGIIDARRADDGGLLWSTGPVGTGPTAGKPVVLGSTVCVSLSRNTDDEAPGGPGVLCGLDTAAGKVRWTAPASGIVQPLPGQDLLLARTGELTGTSPDARPVGALDPLTGAARWQAPASGDRDTIALAPDGGTVYLLDEGHRLCAYDAATGERRWRTPAMDGVITAAEDGGSVYVCTYRGDLAAYDARNGGRRWRRTVAKGFCRPAVAQSGGRLFVTSSETYGSDGLFNMGSGRGGYVLALAADNGKELWRVDRLDTCWSAPKAVGDDVIVTHTSGWWSYDARTGEPRWRLTGVSSIVDEPLVASGVLYGLSDDGVVALRI
ncbi:outer membrane protein assembly factor BamB family protein [Streptomyces hesseae]|uniref:PQQ-binding-like beta-propeller repeat protein n=1 Tax=Streptomyces hesseae TaxID=3075519 RepID=A0ABU2SWQ5_9ACTN|nr:PQQ-binding-like beta-propeller repeat protein [Streptomyces sp. DSM 40473]MDT0453428.1 PQQ-binding-like beta-propeller repeat protein [Streptomyces sp. DSM 40473]